MGAATGRGQGGGALRPSQPAASGTEQGREADKAFLAPSPTAASQKGGGERAAGGRSGRGGRGGGRCCRRDWAGSRQGGRAGRRGWAASENGEEGRNLEGQDKQIVPLHVRGGGGGEGGERARPPSLFPSPKPALCHRAPGTSLRRHRTAPGADDSQTQDGCDLPTAHCEGRRARCGVPGARAEALRALRLPPPGPLRTPAPHYPGRRGGGRGGRHLSELPASPTLEGKQKNLREEIRERILPSGLGSGNCPFLPEKLSHWLLSLPRTHPPSHLSLFHLPATLHSSGLLCRPGKLAGVEAEKLRAREFERRRGPSPQ